MEIDMPPPNATPLREHGSALWRAYAFAKLEAAGKLRRRAASAPQPLRAQLIKVMLADVAHARWGQRYARNDGWRLP
jgi:hypothetical protein